MTFIFDPQPVDDGFVFRGRLQHFTYSGHHQKSDLFNTVARATTIPVEAYSVVHEQTVEYDDDGTIMRRESGEEEAGGCARRGGWSWAGKRRWR